MGHDGAPIQDPMISNDRIDAIGIPVVQIAPRQLEILSLKAQSASEDEIAEHLGISADTIGSHGQRLYRRINVNTGLEAIIYAINTRQLDPTLLVPEDFDPVILSSFTPRERQVLSRVGEEGLGRKGVASTLRVSFRTVSNHLGTIYNKIGTSNVHQAVARYYAAKQIARERLDGAEPGEEDIFGPEPLKKEKHITDRRIEVVYLAAQGLDREDIARVLDISPFTVINHVSEILTILDVDFMSEAIIILVKNGVLDPVLLVPENFDLSIFGRLTLREKEILEQLGKTGSLNKEIAASLGIKEGTVKGHMEEIKAKLGTSNRNQLTTYYLAAEAMRTMEPGREPAFEDVFDSSESSS